MENGKLRILVVDDDPFVRDMMGMILEAAGHEIITAESGEDALEKFLKEGVQLIVSDMNMPGMNGLDLIMKIRASGSDVPVVMLTGNDEISLARDAVKAGANDYLVKDEKIEDTLVLSVDNVWDKYRMQHKGGEAPS